MTETSTFTLCKLSDIGIDCTRAFSIKREDSELEHEVFVVRNQEGVFCYLNQCPHTLATLDWQPDQFLNYDKNYIQCSLHGALFRIHDGFCIWGPCKGRKLRKLQVRSDSKDIVIELPDWCF